MHLLLDCAKLHEAACSAAEQATRQSDEILSLIKTSNEAKLRDAERTSSLDIRNAANDAAENAFWARMKTYEMEQVADLDAFMAGQEALQFASHAIRISRHVFAALES